MKKNTRAFLLSLSVIAWMGFVSNSEWSEKWRDLFNRKNLDGWDTYLGPPVVR